MWDTLSGVSQSAAGCFLSPLLTLLLVECRCGGERPRAEAGRAWSRPPSSPSWCTTHTVHTHSPEQSDAALYRLCHLSLALASTALSIAAAFACATVTWCLQQSFSKSNLALFYIHYRDVASELGGEGPKEGTGRRRYPVGHVACKGHSIPFFGRITRDCHE